MAVSREALLALVDRYLRDSGVTLDDDSIFLKCGVYALDFVQYARKHGYKSARVVSGWQMNDDVDPENLDERFGDPLLINHYAVKIGSWVVDLTFPQFGLYEPTDPDETGVKPYRAFTDLWQIVRLVDVDREHELSVCEVE